LRTCYFQEKNVPLMTMFARRGIQFGLEQAGQTEDSELKDKLRSTAKEMCFNLGANTWPGWEDEGITITAADLAMGLDAARTNLRLAGELQRDAGPLSDAHWLVGAHHLAEGNSQAATEHFKKATEIAEQAGLSDRQWASLGYVAIAEQMDESTRARGDQSLANAIQKLQGLGTDDAKFYASQLQSVSRFFLSR
ncbi:MAG: hypothetical protein KDA80_01945, partial [Planctomycetaceae bacterium]|nr:hypothetical protein [Planctomycetaceae bacterium]